MAALKFIAQGSPDIGLDPDDIAIHLPSDARLDPRAEHEILAAMAEHPQAVAIYWDITVGDRRQARPAWSPTRVQSEPGVCLPLAVRASWPHFDPSCDPLEVERRLAETNAVVLHVPSVLTSHTVAPALGQRPLASDPRFEPGERLGTCRRRPHLHGQANTSIVIPSAGISQPGSLQSMLDRCLETLTLLDPQPLEVVVVFGDEFQGEPPGVRGGETFDLPITAVHRGPGDFDFSQAANSGLRASQGDLVLLLNDDIEAETPTWLGRMAAHLQDPAVGAVGAALLYPNRMVQHVGVVIDSAHPLHPFVGYRLSDTADHGGDVARDVVAVTGACVLARRRDLLAIGGLSSEFPSSFGDIDLCLRLRRSGLRVVIEPAAVLTHLETASRAPVIEPWERDRFARAWSHVTDPWYHPAFHRPDDPRRMNRNADHLGPVNHHGTWPARTTAIAGQTHQLPMNRLNRSETDSEMTASDDIDINRVQTEIEVEAELLRRRDLQITHLEHDMEHQWSALTLPEPPNSEPPLQRNASEGSTGGGSTPPESPLISRLFKRVLRRATQRYTRYVLAQVNKLLKGIHQRLDDQQYRTDHHGWRLDIQNRHLRVLEHTVNSGQDEPNLTTPPFLDPPPALAIETISTIATLAGTAPSLVLSGGAGEIVRSINTNGGSAYGIEANARHVLQAMEYGIDVRSDDFIAHLSSIEIGDISTIVLTGVVESLPLSQLLEIIEQATRILANSGQIVVAVADPKRRDHIESELRAGLGISPATWQYLLDRSGFDTHVKPITDAHITELVVAERPQEFEASAPSPTGL